MFYHKEKFSKFRTSHFRSTFARVYIIFYGVNIDMFLIHVQHINKDTNVLKFKC